jgi:hypothetical protein
MKNLIIITGVFVLSSITLLAQNDPSRNYKMPAQDRKVVKNQDVAINKKNVSFVNTFEAPQNYKHQGFTKKQENQELVVLNSRTDSAEQGINPLESNRNYKSQGISKVINKETNNERLATTKK